MKIVDRKTFLQMSKGTVFCKFPINQDGCGTHYCLGIGAPSILDDPNKIDFFRTKLGSDLFPKSADGSDDMIEILFEMQRNLGMEVAFEHWGGRDGLYEDDSVGFAVYSREEVQEMIDLLQEALKNGYCEEND